MDKALKELIRISNQTGKDPALVQGCSGNTSVKTYDGKFMFIKASGTTLKDMDEKTGWTRMRLDKVFEIINDKHQQTEQEISDRLMLACDGINDKQPSIEAPLHAILDKCVIHLHPVSTGVYTSAKNGQAEIEKLLKRTNLKPMWVPFTNSGIALANKIAKSADEYKIQYGIKPSVIFLQKHGVFISAGRPETALGILNQVVNKCAGKFKIQKAGKMKSVKSEDINDAKLKIRNAYYQATGQYKAVSYLWDNEIGAFGRQANAAKMLQPAAITPNELVYTNGPPMWCENCENITKKLNSQIKKNQKPPVAFLVKGYGLFVAGDGKINDTVRETVKSSLAIRANAFRMGGIVSLTKQEQDFIRICEKQAVQNKISNGILQGQIAVVTGAGSGLGKSIAIGLAKAGAKVALVDIDKNEAQKTAEQLQNFQTMVVQCDVTDEKSVDKAFWDVLNDWGGLDILVNAAGIAPPFGLIDMPADKWRSALDVNLTGYFLMAKAAAKIMIQQGMGGNIINLSSKSGLEPSKNNTAYTTTKAGELAMARGWAMELGEYGIRVNCVCPGNVFEGSKIWNPQYVKECAKKYGIKPDEVIPHYVNKTALKREIKGQDIADAIVFLCSDKARTITGQTLVADSGQVMVR